MEIKNGVGFKDGYLFVRVKGGDYGPNNRAVRLVNTETGDTYDVFEVSHPVLWQEENVVEFLNLVEPKQLPTKDGSVIKNVVLGDDLGSCTIPYAMRVEGQWVGRCSCDIVAELVEQYITNWEEV